jgi:acetate kinase
MNVLVLNCGGCEGLISQERSRPAVYVIPTNEELLIARDTVRCVLKERAQNK